jgi:cell division protease FtsH
LAARDNRKTIKQIDLIKSIEKVMLGAERKSHLLTIEEKKIASYHEAGHALVSSVLPHADPVHKVSVVSRGRAAGYTLKLPIEERHLYTRTHFIDELAVSLGGYAAEKMVFDDITTGASDDISRSTDIARALVTKYGMSEKIGPVAYGDRGEEVFLGRGYVAEQHYSEDVAKEIDEEVRKFMGDALKEAKDVIKKHRSALDRIAEILIERETIERDEFEDVISSFGIKPKKQAVPL